jgi:hypothetical protein
MKKGLFILLPMLLIGLLFVSCNKDDDDNLVNENGLTKEIVNLVPDQILNEIKDLGMPIYSGENPPSIEGSYLAKPFILKSSNIESDSPGMLFADLYIKFRNQNNKNLTIDFDYANGGELGLGYGSYIVGDDGKFSVFVEVDVTYNESKAKVVMIISGKLADDGIKNLYYANFMIDNFGNEQGYWIDNGTGRVLYDEDGFSEEYKFPHKSIGKGINKK